VISLAAFVLVLGGTALSGLHASSLTAEDAPNSRLPIDPSDPAPYDFAAPAHDAPVMAQNTGDWVVAPVPGYNPSQGANLKFLAQYISPPDPSAPAGAPNDVVALGGFYTEEKSHGFGAAYSGSFTEDRFRVLGVAGAARIHYDFYGIGTNSGKLGRSIPVEQDMGFGLVQLLGRVRAGLYGGLRVQALTVDSRVDFSPPGGPILPPAERHLDTNSIGPVLQWDTRDNQFFPTRGQFAELHVDVFSDAMGSDTNYEVYDFAYNVYLSLPHDGVLASRFRFRGTSGKVPIIGMGQLGQGPDIRGYIDGQYRDRQLAAGQVEYRRFFTPRWGAAIFGGAGEVVSSIDDFSGGDLLWAGGAGLRARLSKKNPVSFRLDFAYGKEGPASYVTVGEAF
jgi:hypothetical protein